jgi:hypothetical protein
VRRYIREIASPQSRLMYEAQVRAEQGETEVGTAYAAYQHVLDQGRGATYERRSTAATRTTTAADCPGVLGNVWA